MNPFTLRDRCAIASPPAPSRVVAGCVLAVAATLSGCATVDPSDEEARARALIEEATGVDRLPPYEVSGSAPNPFAANLPVISTEWRLLTVEQAVQTALSYNPRMLAKVAELGIAKADWVRSRWISNPTLSAAALFPSGGGTVGLGGDLALELLDLWRLPIRREIADNELEQAVLELAEFARQLALETRVAYADVVEAEATLALHRRNVELAREMIDLADRRLRAGVATELDTSVATTEWRRREVAVLEAELAALEARSRFEQLSRRSLHNWDLDSELRAPRRALPSADDLVGAAFEERWDLRIARLHLDALERRIDAEEWARFGLISGGVSAVREPRRSGDRKELNVGPTLGLELPLFHQNQPGVAAAQFARVRAHHEANALAADIARQVNVAHARCERYAEIAAHLRDHVLVESQRRLELAKQAYEVGETTSDRVVEATRELIEAERAELAARLNLVRAYDELSAATGLPHDQLGTPLPAEPRETNAAPDAPSHETPNPDSPTPAETGDRS